MLAWAFPNVLWVIFFFFVSGVQSNQHNLMYECYKLIFIPLLVFRGVDAAGQAFSGLRSCTWFCVTESIVADMKSFNKSRWTLRLWLTACLLLCSTLREFPPLKGGFVWSHKRIWNKSSLFHVCKVKMFQRHQAPSIYPPAELFAYYVFLCVADRRWSP